MKPGKTNEELGKEFDALYEGSKKQIVSKTTFKHKRLSEDIINSGNLSERWKVIEDKRSKEKRFIILFGLAGAGKSTILTALYMYLFNNTRLANDPQKNSEGIAYVEDLVEGLEEGSFPIGNKSNQLIHYDASFKLDQEDVDVTFLEFAGEDLAAFSPSKRIRSEQQNLYNEDFKKQLDNFLEKKPKVLFLLVVPFDSPNDHKRLFNNFLSHLRNTDSRLLKNVGVIISKWDLRTRKKLSSLEPKDFISTKMRNINHWFKSGDIQSHNIFCFSIGKVVKKRDTGVHKLSGEPKVDDCLHIVEWVKKMLVDKEREEKKIEIEEANKNRIELKEKEERLEKERKEKEARERAEKKDKKEREKLQNELERNEAEKEKLQKEKLQKEIELQKAEEKKKKRWL